MRAIYSIATLGIALLLLAGCGGGEDEGTAKARPEPPPKLKYVELTLEGFADPDNVGVLMADQQDYFSDAGLNVRVVSPVVTDNVPEYVAQDAVDLGLLPMPELVRAREKGMPLVAVGSLVGRPTAAMIWPRKSKIDGVADLEGKTIAVNGLPVEEGFLEIVLEKAGLSLKDVKIKRLGHRLVPALVKKRADAIFGVSGNVEGAELEARGLEPVVTPLQKLGIPPFEDLVVITRRDLLKGNPGWIRALMSAVDRGTAAAIEDPEAAAEAIAVQRKGTGYGEPGKLALRMTKLEATLPLLSRTGEMNVGQVTRLIDWMHSHGLIQRELPATAVLTNRFVEP